MEKTETRNWKTGMQVHFDSISGRIKLGDAAPVIADLDNLADLTLKGKHMSIRLCRLFLNLQLKDKDDGSLKRFTIAEILFHNVWDYVMSISLSGFKMIDSEGFQHPADQCDHYDFSQVIQDGRKIDVSFPDPESELEDHAKSRGFIWYPGLGTGILPQRLIFSFSIHEPGHTAGWVKDTETLEYFIKSCSTSPANF